MVKLALFALAMAAVSAQPLRVYSEFARIDAAGQVRAPAEPREILSPAVIRNGFTSFQVVVDVPRGTPYQLYLAQNPENAVQATLYRENGEKLERVDQPVSGNGPQVFWLDVWTAADAPVERIKIEPQLHVNNDWVIYPMEGRVTEAVVPEGSATTPALLCGKTQDPASAANSAPGLRFRNARQDAALATLADKEELRKLMGGCDSAPASDAEWYLHIRDYLFRLR